MTIRATADGDHLAVVAEPGPDPYPYSDPRHVLTLSTVVGLRGRDRSTRKYCCRSRCSTAARTVRFDR